MAQISTITIPALVISYNNNLFLDPNNSELITGKVLYVPCRNLEFDNEDMWAIPVKDAGVFTGCEFQLKNGIFLNQPTFDSFTVFQIKDKLADEQWIIYGTRTDFINSCATCCGASAVPMPGISPAFGERIAPCELMDLTNDSEQPYMLFGLPSLQGSERYYPVGSRNNVGYTQASANGYSSISDLLTFLNANFTPYTWTVSADNLTLTATGGSIGDSLCISVIGITPSGS